MLQKVLNIFIKTYKNNIEVFDAPSYFEEAFLNIIKLFMRRIWLIDFQTYYKNDKKKLCKEISRGN